MPYNPGVSNEGGKYIMQGMLAAVQAINAGLNRRADRKEHEADRQMQQDQLEVGNAFRQDNADREWYDSMKRNEPWSPPAETMQQANGMGYYYMPQSQHSGTFVKKNDPTARPTSFPVDGGNVIDLGNGKRAFKADPATPLPAVSATKIQSNLDQNKNDADAIAGYQAQLDKGNEYTGMDWWRKYISGGEEASYRNKIAATQKQMDARAAANTEIIRTFKAKPAAMPGYPALPAAPQTPAGAAPAAAAPVAGTRSAQDQAALDWANANASDPRAAKIKQRLGVQ